MQELGPRDPLPALHQADWGILASSCPEASGAAFDGEPLNVSGGQAPRRAGPVGRERLVFLGRPAAWLWKGLEEGATERKLCRYTRISWERQRGAEPKKPRGEKLYLFIQSTNI